MYYIIKTLFFSPQSLIFDEVDLSDASVAETSTKNINNSFTVNNQRDRLWLNLLHTFVVLREIDILDIYTETMSTANVITSPSPAKSLWKQLAC